MRGRAKLNFPTHQGRRTARRRWGASRGLAWGTGYDPYSHAEALGLDVTISRRVAGFGDYRNGKVRLHPDLIQAEARCTLAHEIVHHEHRDDILGYCAVGFLDSRLEHAVHAIAARRLIVVSELVDAIRWSEHPAEIAEQLVVDTRTLYAWVQGMTRDDYATLVEYVRERVRRPLADLRREAARRIPAQRCADAL